MSFDVDAHPKFGIPIEFGLDFVRRRLDSQVAAEVRVVLRDVDESLWFESFLRRRSANGETGEAGLRLLRDHGC